MPSSKLFTPLLALLLSPLALLAQSAQPDAPPVNPDATPAARALLQEIDALSGHATLSGQHNFPNSLSRYSDRIYELTGEYPAVFGQDFGFSGGEDKDSTLSRPSMIQEVIRQYRNGAVIALTWHSVRPTDDEPVTFHDSVQGHLTDEQFQQVLTPGTDLYSRWARQADVIAGYLQELQTAGVPVLFRPYHEMNGNWFWWGGRPGPTQTAALYRQIYDRYVHLHHLNNLIWVWNVNAPSVNAGPIDAYFPGMQYVDILSMDIYGPFDQAFYDSMVALAGPHKPIALAEVGAMPTLQTLAAQPRWTYFMMWSGMAERSNSPAQLQAMFHAPNVINRNDPRLPAPVSPPSASAPAGVHFDPSPSAVVKIEGGRLQGAEPAPGIRAYLGIPYAQPPIGPLRWQPPQPISPWTDLRPAVSHGTPCPQQKFGWNDTAADHGNEDCLFLNVWAPVSGSKYPVMVYLHGGSNVAGSASEGLSSGLALVPHGVVLVTLDYRLGIFGFFRTPALDSESSHHASGNYGLLDQIAALHWVQTNISAFGGDPTNVTLFGQSAGAVDTGLLMASPLARGLFARALEESGQVLGLMPTATQTQSESAWATVAQSLGSNLAAMRSASTAEVLRADLAAPKPPPENFWGLRGASVDGWVLPELPSAIFAKGSEAPVPLLIGSNVQEIVPKDQPPEETKHLIESALNPDAAHKLEAIYTHPPANTLEGDAGARFQTDRDFRCPVRQIAAWHASHGFPTFVYQFDRSAGSDSPAHHSSELSFVFGYFPSHKESAADLSVADLLQRYWTTFARTGNVNADGLPSWPRFSAASGAYLHFSSNNPKPSAAENLGGQPCEVLSAAAVAR